MTTSDNGQHFATRTRAEKKSLTFFREAGRGKALVQINNYVKFHPGLILLMGEEGSGRSRVLKQFSDSLRNKPGRICILDRAIKNEDQLYAAIADGFAMDFIPGENLKSMQKAVFSFLETNVESNKPVIVALDNTHQCTLAVLEALIALRARFTSMSLILVGDNGLQKMVQRLRGGELITGLVSLASLDAREVRQYINWRMPFQISDLELANIVNVSRGNIGLLEHEAMKKEISYHQKSTNQSNGGLVGDLTITRGTIAVMLILTAMVCGAGVVYFFHRDRAPSVTEIFTKAQPLITGMLTVIPGIDKKPAEIIQVMNKVENVPAALRSNQEWVEQQVILLTDDVVQ